MISIVRSVLRPERGRTQLVLGLALMAVLGVAAFANAQYAAATLGTSGDHTDVGFDITSSFDAGTSTWTY